MRQTRLILLGALAALPSPAQSSPAQTTPAPQQPKLTVVIDAARGGGEYGARIDGRTYEKQVTLDLANRLRSLLTARDFNVVLTRDGDAQLTNEQRAAVANQNKPVACLLLHATAAGTGLHLWTSSLNPMPVGSTAVPWDEAQAPFVQRSQRLATEFAGALSRSRIAVSAGHTWIRPLDNMQCPAVAIEIAPEDSDTLSSDRGYQTHIAAAIASQLLFWRGHADIVELVTNPPPPPAQPKPVTVEKTAEGSSPAHTSLPAATSPGSSSEATPVPRVRTASPGTTSLPPGPPASSPRPAPSVAPRPRPATPSTEAQPQ